MPSNPTVLLERIAQGDPASAGKLLPLVYDELRSVARGLMRGEAAQVTLQPTALVHDAFLRMVDQTRVSWKGRAHFLAIAARMMRRVLIDHHRRRGRAKRGGNVRRITLAEGSALGDGRAALDAVELHDALERLGQLNEREAKVAELRLFAGLSVDEAAEVLGVSPRTVDDDWAMAKVWLRRELAE